MAAAAADRVEGALDLALVAGEAHGHALALEALGNGGPHHFALLAVLEPVAVPKGLTHPREVDLLSYRVAARQRWWRLAAYLCEREVQACPCFACSLEMPCCLGCPRFEAAPPRLAIVASAVVVVVGVFIYYVEE